MYKKMVLMVCLIIIASLCQGLDIHLESGRKIIGEINAKKGSYYYIAVKDGYVYGLPIIKIPVDNVKKIAEGIIDYTGKYADMPDFNDGVNLSEAVHLSDILQMEVDDLKKPPSTSNMTEFEMEMLDQCRMINENTAKFNTTVWTIWGVSIGISLLAILMSR